MFKNTSWKTIEGWREVRMWISQIIAPIAGVVVLSPTAREWVKNKLHQVKDLTKEILSK